MSIQLKDVTKIYITGVVETRALDKVSLEINDGEVVVLLGPSGSGKSTLLNVCSGLDTPTDGIIKIGDEMISEMNTKELTFFRRKNIGFIFQRYNLLQALSVRENVDVGREISDTPMEVEDVIDQVGLLPMIDKYPFQLSGGEQQRVSIARAVVKNPKIMFCDEPTGALDEENAKGILSVLQNMNETYGTTLVLITHNPNIAVMADRVVKLNNGKIVDVIKNEHKKRASKIIWG